MFVSIYSLVSIEKLFWLKLTSFVDFLICSSLMDCVGCEKCRLWGKLQVFGLGAALNILFSVDDIQNKAQPVSFFTCFSCKVMHYDIIH